jgi:hypothetical protein
MNIQKDYEAIIQWKKQEHHINGWNVMDLSCEGLLEETETNNVKACIEAMKECMLEGDSFLTDENLKTRKFAVRYYCDNLSESRRKMFW